MGFPNDPQACRREISAPKNIATFNTHTEALEPMAGVGIYDQANAEIDELISLAEEKASPFWRALGMLHRGYLTALTGTTAETVNTITTALTVFRPTGSRMWEPLYSAHLSYAHAKLGQFEEASRCIDEAMGTIETTKEKWYEAEMCRIAGEIALLSPQLGVASAETHFERALAIARQQQAKSWELRASMSMARLWRDQDKRDEARDLLAPVYGWFTEGFDTLDLKEAKALLDGLC